MLRQSHYNINVSRQHPTRKQFATGEPLYVHLFHTEVVEQANASNVAAELRKRFPSPEFKVDVMRWEFSGRHVDL